MKKHAAILILAAFAGLVIGTQGALEFSSAQDSTETAKPAAKRPRGRLPNYFGQVGISGTQREEIYKIQAAAQGEIAKLHDQIAKLEKKRDEDVRAVLTEDQLKKVDELVAAAKKRAEERRKKRSAN